MHRTFRAAAVLALALALILPGAAMAATTSSTTTVNATVLSSISMSGIPATYALGSAAGGNVLNGTAFPVTVVSSEDDFTVNAKMDGWVGPGSIAANTLAFVVNGNAKPVVSANTDVLIFDQSVSSPSVSLRFTIPASAKSGAYSTTVTFTAAN